MQEPSHQESTLRTVVRVAVNTCVLFVVLVSNAILDRLKQWLGFPEPVAEETPPDNAQKPESSHGKTSANGPANILKAEAVYDGSEPVKKSTQKHEALAKSSDSADMAD